MSSSRREFLVQSSASAAAFTLLGGSALTPVLTAQEKKASTMKPLPIIDTHQHLWDLTKFKLPWISSAPELARSYVTKDYLAEVAGLNFVKAVYMEVDVDPSQQVAEAEHLIELSKHKENVTVAAVISGRPASDAFAPYIKRLKQFPAIKGVRQVLHVPETPAGFCLKPEFVAGVKLLGELGLSFDACMRPTELSDTAKLADACPGTRIIIDHCGNGDPLAFAPAQKKVAAGAKADEPSHKADPWRRDIEALAKRPNTICKISGIVARAPKGNWDAGDLAPIVNHCLDTFGPDRVVFGSDWPVCTLRASIRQWVAALLEIISSRPIADQAKLLSENADRLYALK